MSIILVILLSIFSAYSQTDRFCYEEEEETSAVRNLVERAKSKNLSIDESLEALPDSIRSEFIFMAESKSLQGASVDSPRVILSSPGSQVRITFGTNPELKGFDRLEISFWDTKTQSFEYTELKFDLEKKTPPVQHGNGECIHCHGNPPKPNWDSYNYWAGMVPFNKGTLVKGSKEVEWYSNYIKRTRDKTPGNRLQYLKPKLDEKTFQSEIEEFKYHRVNLGSGMSAGIALADSLRMLQECAAAAELERNKSFDAIKYLLAGIQLGCPQIKNFVPEDFHKIAGDFFSATINGFKASPKSSAGGFDDQFKQVEMNTESRLSFGRLDKENRQRLFLAKALGDDKQANKEIELSMKEIGINTIGESGQAEISKVNLEERKASAEYRYFLESLGVDLTRFSTVIDPAYYNYGDGLRRTLISEKALQRLTQGKEKTDDYLILCTSLAASSKEAIGKKPFFDSIAARSKKLCEQKLSLDHKVNELSEFEAALVEKQAGEIFKNSCLECHQVIDEKSQRTELGAIPLPFGDIKELKTHFNSPEGRLLKTANRIYDRINRPHFIKGAMPLQGASTELDIDEKKFLNAWLKSYQIQSDD